MNFADYVLELGEADRPALVTETRPFMYRDLHEASARLAAELLATGVQPGARVGILGSNSLFWVAAYLASLKLGAVAVPLPATRTPEDIALMRQVAGLMAVCAEERTGRRFTGVLGDLPTLTDAVLRQPGPCAWPSAGAADQDDAALMFTSGTTARPKAVRITHRNLQANTDSIIEYLNLTAAERIFVVLPFDYCFGTSLLHTHLRVGGALVLNASFMYPETTLNWLEASEATGLAGVPSIYQTLLRRTTFTRRPLRALRKIQQAGGKLSDVLIKELVAAVPQAEVFVMYGQTEATARLSYLPPALLTDKLGSLGRGIPGVTLRVLDPDGQPVKPGEVGEIWAEGDNISPGYLDDPEATAQKFPGGQLRTGDLATVDADGFIFIASRECDFIKSRGYRISSLQVEDCVLELTEVVSAAAVGVPDAQLGEAIRVFVTLRPESALHPQDVVRHCGQRLARYMVPQEVVICERLPLNANGKINKAELRACAA
jgi:acyl-CoA synthetase (AMP-forming)/AMP-acid ligase II